MPLLSRTLALARSSKSNVSDRASVGMIGAIPTITSRRTGSHPQPTRDSGFPLRLTLPTVAPGQTPGALRFVSLALHILSHKGERRRRHVSARNVSEPHFFNSETRFSKALPLHFAHTPTKSRGAQQAWMNSRNQSNVTNTLLIVNFMFLQGPCIHASTSA